MVNCNPETVSTDFDESHRLYFEELSLERVSFFSFFPTPYFLMTLKNFFFSQDGDRRLFGLLSLSGGNPVIRFS
jgi:hypothetical protein